VVRRPAPRSTLLPYTTLFRSSIEADFTFSQFHANGPGKLAIYGALSDDADASDDFHVNGMTFDLGGTINGNVYLNKHSLVNLFRSEEHTSELQSRENLVCRLL